MSERLPPEDMPTRRRRQDIVVRRPPTERIPPQPEPHVRGGPEPSRRSQPPRQQPPPRPTDPGSSPLSVPWWAFAIVILVVAGITCGLWWFALANRGDTSTTLGPTPTPIFVVITSTPTLGAEAEEPQTEETPAEAGETPGAQPTALPPLPTKTPAPSQIGIGSTIVITGTEGDGLAIRQGPGVDYSYFFVGNDGDTFVVEDGPREADGYTWWYIVDPADPNRAGWAVEAFMEITS
jgi:hypothetical protein